jgi:tRNA(Ile)-lysidine synthase
MADLHPFQKRVLCFIQEQHLIRAGDHVLVAVSGGPDSVVLLHVLLALQATLQVAKLTTVHLDHQLRGEESRQDARFVQDLSERWGVACHGASAAVESYRRLHRVSLEMAARDCRQRFFEQERRDLQAQSVALGQHADDQAEEILLRLLRGTGPGGIAGMAAKTPQGFIRPLLFATREEILGYAHDLHLPYRVDSSNLSSFCQRNALRLEVLPLLRTHIHPHVVRTLSRCADLARDEEDAWAQIIEEYWQRVVLDTGENRVSLAVGRMSSLFVAIQRRLLRRALESVQGNLQSIQVVHIEALRRLLETGAVGKQVHLPGGLRGLREPERLVIRAKTTELDEPFLPTNIAEPGCHRLAAFDLELRHRAVSPGEAGAVAGFPRTSQVVWMDADQLRWPLLVRSWQPGDRFQPLGLKGTMKLQDYFTNARVPREERHRIPLLCDQEKICWVVGQRLDDRVKITAATRRVLVAQWGQE